MSGTIAPPPVMPSGDVCHTRIHLPLPIRNRGNDHRPPHPLRPLCSQGVCSDLPFLVYRCGPTPLPYPRPRAEPTWYHLRAEALSKLHKLGLMPLVKEIQVRHSCSLGPWFAPQAFSLSPCHFRYLAAFSNVQTLRLQKVNFNMPCVERYCKRFSHTLRSVTSFKPCCTLLYSSTTITFPLSLPKPGQHRDLGDFHGCTQHIRRPRYGPRSVLRTEAARGVGAPWDPLGRDLGAPHHYMRWPTVPSRGPARCSRLCVHSLRFYAEYQDGEWFGMGLSEDSS